MTQSAPVQPPRASLLGCSALLFEANEANEAFGEAAQRRVWHVAQAAGAWTGVLETVPGMNNLMVVFDPGATSPQALIRAVEAAWQLDPTQTGGGKLVELPVVYGGEGGPDLQEVASHAGLDIDTVVRLHSEAVYSVYFLGAHPGFAYLGGLDPRLRTPRRAEPRLEVRQGAVAIGGMQAGVVAQTSPSGWRLIGTTEQQFFDPTGSPPALLAPGDRVRFRPLRIER